jgi:hypothetical protein
MATFTRHSIGTAVWIGILLGPLAWAASQGASHVLASVLCGPTGSLAALALHGAGVAGALLGAALCGWSLSRAKVERPSAAPRSEHRFMAGLGFGICLFFAIVTLAQGLAGLFFGGCTS